MNSSPSRFRAAAHFLWLFWSFAAFAVQPSARPQLPNFDIRTAAPPPPAAPDPGREAAVAELRRRVPGVRIDRPATGIGPKTVGSTRGFLTGRRGEGFAVPPAVAGGFPPNDSHREVKAFVEEHREFFGHGADALTAAPTTRDSTHGRLRSTVWQQDFEGIPIFEAVLQANRTVDGELVNISSTFVPEPAKATPKRAAQIAAPTISVAEAVVRAAADLSDTISAVNVVPSGPPTGKVKRVRLRAPKLLDVSAEHVWFPLDDKTLRLCWQVVLVSKARGEMFKILVDAESGAVLLRHGLTNYISDASYRVFTSDSPSPFSPGHPTPSTVQPSTIARTLVVTPALDPVASPSGWIDDGVNETRGNNVDAHLDLDANDVADTPRPQGTNRVFDFPLDLSQPPSTYRNASVTQLFYVCNWIHDKLYALGFTETAGNFQNNNFGRGGLGGDAVQADAQDGEGTNNANFGTPPDGSAPRMQMFVFDGPNPDRDGSFDVEIVIHEYVHGLSNRLVGGGVGISTLQAGGMGEGWSDFYGLALLGEAGDDLDANYAAGGYATYQFAGLTTNYYSGIRRYPYSTDLTKNPLTFRDIDPTQASSHPGIPRSPVIGNTANEVHNMGEVWCVTLWDARANLIAKHGFATGNQLILQLVTDGMKLAPANPNFLQARDGILQADLVLNGGNNQGELWSAFAKRGMGANATSPSSSTAVGVMENYELPDDLTISPTVRFSARGPVGGPYTPGSQVFTLTNTNSTNALAWSVSGDQPWVSLSIAGGSLAAGGTTNVTVMITAAANALPAGVHDATISFTNTDSAVVQARTVRLLVGVPDYFTEVFEPGTNDTVFQSWMLTPDGSSSFYAVLRTIGVTAFPTDPSGGTNVTLSDDAATQANLAGGEQVSLYGTSYGSFFISSNGYVTFGSSDTEYEEAATTHFNRPRIAALFDDLLPPSGGTISWRQLGDRVAVTYDQVPEYGTTNSNSLQIEMFFDGRIRITCLGIDATDGLIGLSRGTGTPADFEDSDFSTYSAFALTVNLPDGATEGTLAAGTVTSLLAPTSDLTIALSSDNPSQATVPPTVTILAGQTSAAFNLTAVDDAGLDGSHAVSIRATAAGYSDTPDSILIHDNETATLTLTALTNTAEGVGSFPATVTISAPAVGDVEVFIDSSSPTELAVPPSVVIPGGSTSANFEVAVIDDNVINGTRNVTLTARVQNWTADNVVVTISDNESKALSFSLPSPIYESTIVDGTVSASGTVAAPLVVSLTSGVTSRLTVPATVTIPAGASSATFQLTATNNSATDGSQTVVVTGTAATFTSATATAAVRDDDVHHFTFGSIASPQVRGVPISVAITARDFGGGAIAIYAGTPSLSASGSIAITPTVANGFVNGVWSGSIVVNSFATGVVIGVADGAGHSGASNAFNVGVGALHHFAWAPVGGPHFVGTPIAATVLAQDLGGNVVTSFTGTANLSGVTGNPNASSVVITEVNPNTPDEIEFVNVSTAAVNLSGWTVHVYDADTWPGPRNAFTIPAGTTCAAGQVFRLQEIGTAPGTFPQFFLGENINWTASSGTTAAVLLRDASGNIMDFFCGGAATPASITNPVPVPAAQWTGTPATAPANETLDFTRIGGSEQNTVADWTTAALSLGTVNPGLTLPFPPALTPIAVSPTVTGSFTNGTWNGILTVLQPASQMRLRATDGAGHEGESANFTAVAAASLTVTPAGSQAVAGPFGGPFTPSALAYTITNSGTTSLNWTATKTANWLTLAPASGTLAVGASATVTATIAADFLEPGVFAETVTFINTTNGVGNTTRPIELTIVLGTPVIVPEPASTGGTANTISWNAITGAALYDLERATAADFANLVSTGPIASTSHTFTPLIDGTTYHYRVRARRPQPGAALSWSQSSTAELETGTATNVSITPTGGAVLSGQAGAVLTGRITNPSFEGGSLNDWTVEANSSGMAAQSTSGAGVSPMPTAGAYYAGMRSQHNTVRTAGEFVRLTRTLDLTGATSLAFDALLASPAGSTWSGSLRAELRIDGVTLWSSDTAGPALNQAASLAGYTGNHVVEFRAEMITTGTFNAQWFFLDNVRLVGPGFATAGTLVSPTIALAARLHWETLVFSRDISAAGTALTVDVLSGSGALLAANVPSGTDLRTLPAVTGQSQLSLRANFSTTNSAATPTLHDWTVNYRAAGPTDNLSPWSTVAKSRQDAVGPSITINPVTLLANTVEGTATDTAGISGVVVNGVAATSTDGFSNWMANVPLVPGANAINISATDGAVLPNPTTGVAAVFYASMGVDTDGDGLPDAWEAANGLNYSDSTGANGALGDGDADGVNNLLERAFGLDPAITDVAGLPAISREINPGDSQPYLVLRYRRLLAPGPMLYTLQLSPDLQSWTAATAADFESIGAPTTNEDGITESVTLRIKPALFAPGNTKRHVRIEVRVP